MILIDYENAALLQNPFRIVTEYHNSYRLAGMHSVENKNDTNSEH